MPASERNVMEKVELGPACWRTRLRTGTGKSLSAFGHRVGVRSKMTTSKQGNATIGAEVRDWQSERTVVSRLRTRKLSQSGEAKFPHWDIK